MRKCYTPEFKEKIYSNYANGKTVSEISAATGLSRSTIYSWINEAQNIENSKKKPLNLHTMHDLNVKVKRQETIIEILKESPCSPSAPLSEKYKAIQTLASKYSETTLCDALNVAKGSYFNHIFRNANENTKFAQKKKELTLIIEEIYHKSEQRYGASRIHIVLKDRGYKVSERTVARIMQENGWFSVRGGSKALYKLNQERRENLLKQEFIVTAPNKVWVSDVTYYSFKNKTYYICAILDLYARKVISHYVSLKNNTYLTKKTLKKHIKTDKYTAI